VAAHRLRHAPVLVQIGAGFPAFEHCRFAGFDELSGVFPPPPPRTSGDEPDYDCDAAGNDQHYLCATFHLVNA
jgi:hypothetical protein